MMTAIGFVALALFGVTGAAFGSRLALDEKRGAADRIAGAIFVVNLLLFCALYGNFVLLE